MEDKEHSIYISVAVRKFIQKLNTEQLNLFLLFILGEYQSRINAHSAELKMLTNVSSELRKVLNLKDGENDW